LEAKKGERSRYATLLARDVLSVQSAHIRTKFELAPASMVAEKACCLTNEAIASWEDGRGIRRLRPGEVLFEKDGKTFVLPLLEREVLAKLGREVSSKAIRRELEVVQYQRLKEVNPEASFEDLWRLIDQSQLTLRRQGKDFLPESPLNAETLRPASLNLAKGEIPLEALKPAIEVLVEEWGLRPGQAEGMVGLASQIYAWCCPRIEVLQPGQVVWLAHGTRRSRRTDPRLFSPVVLTLITPEEMDSPLTSRADLKRLKTRQIERLTAEAWRQDGVLTTLDLEWLLGVSTSQIREILEAYHERFGILLPTAGTVLDMGRTLTHKTIVVEMALSGLTTVEIARRIYHTPEAVDQYLRTFDRVLMLRYYRVPFSAIVQVVGHSRSLVEEHLELAEKHFPDEDAIAAYLAKRGIELERSG